MVSNEFWKFLVAPMIMYICSRKRRRKERNPITYMLGTERIPMTKDAKDLGVIINHNLSWHNHILAKVNTANKVLRLIKRTCRNCTPPKVILKLWSGLILNMHVRSCHLIKNY